jgi:hypothetical protein
MDALRGCLAGKVIYIPSIFYPPPSILYVSTFYPQPSTPSILYYGHIPQFNKIALTVDRQTLAGDRVVQSGNQPVRTGGQVGRQGEGVTGYLRDVG